MNFKEKIANRSAYANVLKTYQHVELYVGKFARVTGPLQCEGIQTNIAPVSGPALGLITPWIRISV